MFLTLTSVFAYFYLVALHSSMAGMELFSSLLILMAVIGVAQKRVSFETKFQTPILIFLGAILLNVLVTPALVPWSDRFSEIRWIFLYWGVAKALEIVWSEKFERTLLKVWIFALSLTAVYATFQFFAGEDLIRGHSAHLARDGDVFRATGFFSLCLTFAYSIGHSGLSLTMPIQKIGKKLPLLALTATVLVVLVSMTRGAWLAFAISLPLLIFLIRKQLSRLQVFVISLILVAPVIGLISTEGGQRRLFRLLSFQMDKSSSIRIDVWRGYLQMFKENPIFGVGFDQGQLFLERAYIQLEIAQDFVSHAHNDYIQMLAETGIVGFSAYMLLLGWTLTQTFKLRKSHFNWAVSLFCAQIYVLLGSLTQANFSDSEVNHFLVFSWAIVSVLSNRRSEK